MCLSNYPSVPPNCCFEIDDVEDEWVYGQEFDYIHGRLLTLCFNDGAAVFKKAFKASVVNNINNIILRNIKGSRYYRNIRFFVLYCRNIRGHYIIFPDDILAI